MCIRFDTIPALDGRKNDGSGKVISHSAVHAIKSYTVGHSFALKMQRALDLPPGNGYAATCIAGSVVSVLSQLPQ